MPTTPLGVWTPDDGDDWDLTIDLAAMAISIDAALIAGATRVIGTDAERIAATAPLLRNGLEFYATDTGIEWRYTSGAWASPFFIYNMATARSTASTQGSITTTPVQLNALAPSISMPQDGQVRVSGLIRTYSGNTADVAQIEIRRGVTTLGTYVFPANSSSSLGTTTMTSAFSDTFPVPAGSHVFTAWLSRVAGSGSITSVATALSANVLTIDRVG